MTLLTEVKDLSRIGYGFMASKALFAALELDLFTHLADAQLSADDLVQRTGASPNALRTLLRACASLGLVGVDGAHYVNSPAATSYLARQSPRYFGDYFRLQIDRQIYPSLQQLGEALHGRPTTPWYEWMDDPGQAELFSRAQHVGSMGPAHLLAQRVDARGWQRLLDVAGGSGAFSIALCRRYPDLHATILDLPNVIPITRRYVDEGSLSRRVTLLAGDAFETPWPADQDAVLMSYLLSAVPAEGFGRLFRKAYDALAPGGTLLLHDFMLDDSRHGPTHATLWFVANTIGGQGLVSFAASDLIAILGDCGFAEPNHDTLLPGITSLVTAVRPR